MMLLRWVLVLMLSFGLSTFQALAASDTWQYSSKEDKMRGIKYDYATITSLNIVEFGFPYSGGSKLMIGIRKKNGELDDIMLIISKGQILCGISNCTGAMKFGDSAVDSLTLVEPEDHDPKIVFVRYSENFLKNLKKHDKLVLELKFFQEGAKQFEFDIRGLKF